MTPFLALLGPPLFATPSVESASAAVERMGVALGRPVGVERSLGQTPVFVDASDLKPDAALRALAFALHASLVPDGKGLRIERTAADRKALRAAHVAVNRARVDDAFAKWDRILTAGEALGDEAAQVKRARADQERVLGEAREASAAHRAYAIPVDMIGENMVTPASRLLRKIAARMGLPALTDLAPGETRFLSDHPNAAESPLPPCDDLLPSFTSRQSAYGAAMDLPDVAGPPAKLIFRISERAVSLSVFDAGGRLIARDGINYLMKPVIVSARDPAAPAPPEPRWVELGEAGRAMDALFRLRFLPIDQRPPRELPEAYLHPERTDPLAFAAQAGLVALPRASGSHGLVAALADDLVRIADGCVREGRLNAAAFERALLGVPGVPGAYERVADDGATVVRPKDALVATVADRAALGQAVRRIVADGDLSLDNWSGFYLATYPGSPVTTRYLWQSLPWTGRSKLASPLRFDGRWEGAWALLGAARAARRPEIEGDRPPIARIVRDGMVTGQLRFEGGTDLDRSPSSLLAILGQARLFVTTETETPGVERYGGMSDAEAWRPSFSGMSPEETGQSAFFSASQGWNRNSKELKELIMKQTVYDPKYRLGHRFDFAVDVRLKGGIHAPIKVLDAVTDRVGLDFADLSPEFRERILRGVQYAIDHPPTRGGTVGDPSPPPATGRP